MPRQNRFRPPVLPKLNALPLGPLSRRRPQSSLFKSLFKQNFCLRGGRSALSFGELIKDCLKFRRYSDREHRGFRLFGHDNPSRINGQRIEAQ